MRAIDFVFCLLGLAAVAAVPWLMWKWGNPGFLAADITAFRLTKQPDGIMAPNLRGWLGAGVGGPAWATLLPITAVVVALGLLFWRRVRATTRAHLALALIPAVTAMALGYFQLRWWQVFGAALIPLLVVVTHALREAPSRAVRAGWMALLAVTFAVGLSQVVPRSSGAGNVLTVPEVEGLVERDLAQWLATHHDAPGGPVVLAPPSVTSALCFYGGLRGLGTIDWENKDGLSVALRIVISTSREEALALLRKRGVTHIVIPSWDDFFASYMGPASVQNGELFFAGLERWSLPTWLRPIPYPLPKIAGFETNTLKVLEVVDDQGDALAASRLAEYFVEMGQIENAKASDELLRRYPADLGAWIARGQLYAALGDANNFGSVLETLVKRLSSGGDRFLPWERRVSLASVLARGKRLDLARAQTELVLKDLNVSRVRSLTTYSLYHLLTLAKAFNLHVADPAVRELALNLLPTDLRERVQ